MGYGSMANLGYITYISIKNHSFKSSLIGFYKASRSTSTCLKIYKPLRLCNKKIIQFKCGEIAGPDPGKPFWRNERLYHIFSRRSYLTYPRSFIRRKEILVLIFAGISGGVLYGWSKKLENDRRDREMEELDGLIKIAQESHSSGKNEVTVKLYKEALQRVKILIDAEVQSHQRMSTLTTKFVFIIDQIANLLHNLGKLDEAEDYYKQTVQALISHGAKKDDDAVIEISLKLASIYAEQERHELAENGFTWCVNNARRKVNENEKFDMNSAALLGICLESYGKYRISQRDANKAISLFTEALEISRKVFGTKHQQVVLLLNNLAVAYNEAGDTEEARKLFYKTIDLAKEVKSDDLWSFHFNLANVLVQTGKTLL
ncbi:tetratricopeptide repeat 19, mitochondrial isoform X5 [Paramuricea clavata]|uniref:Tetratricopeptide repeat 19, mitochondrial isoform X5 n=1 Tax=Paramuricea clavata TaxID=317549 RepID=A0A7D9E0H5_PARCT|nr:tetratricopeptide repeat 19, mitochondrial isoform X5 [Paramuricea clavata]